MPNYPDKQKVAYPYLIAVTDPRPTPQQGQAKIYGFYVDDPFPTVPIPLANDETLLFDFGTVYQRTFESLSYFGNRVDYGQEPERLNTYSREDQARIRRRMQAVLEEREV